MFANFLDSVKSGVSGLKQQVQKLKNQKFLECTMASCVMVAYANGTVEQVEKKKLMAHIEHNDALSVFATNEVLACFQRWFALFEFDTDVATTKALSQIATLRGNDLAARTLIRICMSIGAADGDFDEREKDRVRAICRETGLDLAE